MWGRVRRRRRSEAARPAPEESPAMRIWEGGIAEWKALGGGERRERYAMRPSRRAEGNMF